MTRGLPYLSVGRSASRRPPHRRKLQSATIAKPGFSGPQFYYGATVSNKRKTNVGNVYNVAWRKLAGIVRASRSAAGGAGRARRVVARAAAHGDRCVQIDTLDTSANPKEFGKLSAGTRRPFRRSTRSGLGECAPERWWRPIWSQLRWKPDNVCRIVTKASKQ